MKSLLSKVVLFIALVFAPMANAYPERDSWIGSFGAGMFVGPGALLLNPEIHKVLTDTVWYGVSLQMGLGSNSLLTLSGTARYQFEMDVEDVHPYAEGAMGLAVAAKGFTSSVGVHLMFGAGADYELSSDLLVGMVLRFNFAPPIDNLVFGWLLATARIQL